MLPKQYAELGKITHVRGLHGHLVAQISPDVATLDPIEYLFIQVGHTFVPYYIEEKVFQHHQATLRLQDITDRSTAQELIGKPIWVPKEELEKLLSPQQPEETLAGYQVVDMHGGNLGIVQNIEKFPMNTCLVVDYHNKELLIPYAAPLIQQIDPIRQQIVVQLPPGFLEALGCK